MRTLFGRPRFPEYKPHDEKVSLWAESYGGHYGPAFMDCKFLNPPRPRRCVPTYFLSDVAH